MATLLDRRAFVAACAAAGLPRDLAHQLWAGAAGEAAGDGPIRLDPITKDQIVELAYLTDGHVWVVYPKGVKTITAKDVIAAGRAARRPVRPG